MMRKQFIFTVMVILVFAPRALTQTRGGTRIKPKTAVSSKPTNDSAYNFDQHNNIRMFINDLAKAVGKGDKVNVAQMIHFPFVDEFGDNPNNESEPLGCRTVDQFFEKYDKIFTSDTIKAIIARKYRGYRKDPIEGDVIKQGEYLVGCFESGSCKMFGVRKIGGKFQIYAMKFYS